MDMRHVRKAVFRADDLLIATIAGGFLPDKDQSGAGARHLYQVIARMKPDLEKAEIFATLDSVLFADGEFWGPDLGAAFGRIKAEENGRSELLGRLREMSSKSNSEILSFLKTFEQPRNIQDAKGRRQFELATALAEMIPANRGLMTEELHREQNLQIFRRGTGPK